MRSKILLSLAPAALALALPAQPGTVIGTLSAPDVPYGVGTGLNGELFMVSQSRVLYELSLTGSVIRQFSIATDTGAANGVCFDGTNFYVTDSSLTTRGIDVYDSMGTYLRTIAVPGTFPAGICYNPTNAHLYCSDRVAGAAITEFDLAGNQLGTFTANGTAVAGVSYEPTSNEYWTLDAVGDTLDSYDSVWSPITSFPGPLTASSGRGRSCVSIARALYVAIPATSEIAIFDTTGTLASLDSVGTSCPQPGVFYELFAGTGTGDLTGQTYRFNSASGTGWNASASGQFITNLGTNLNLGDDTLLRNQPLGFSFNIPGSPRFNTNAIDISSNGWIGLNPNEIPDTGFVVLESGAEFVKYERIAGWWDDLDPSVSGGVYFNQLSNPQRVVITWDQVPQFGATDSNTVQIVLFANGDFQITWQAGCLDDALTGFSAGGNVADNGGLDLSASVPGLFGPYGASLDLSSERPVIGTTVNYRIFNVPTNASFAALLFGSSSPMTPLDPIGMAGCFLNSSSDLATANIGLPGATLPFAIPNDMNLVGANVYHQAVVVAAGFNSLGVIATNGLKFRIGT